MPSVPAGCKCKLASIFKCQAVLFETLGSTVKAVGQKSEFIRLLLNIMWQAVCLSGFQCGKANHFKFVLDSV